MQHEVGAGGRALGGVQIRQVAFDHLDVGRGVPGRARGGLDVLALARAEVVHHADSVTPAKQFFREMRPDESCPARHRIPRHALPRPRSASAGVTCADLWPHSGQPSFGKPVTSARAFL